jgi:spermidine synthase
MKRVSARSHRLLLSVAALLASACAAPPLAGDQVRFREVSAFQTVVVVDDAERRCMRFGDGPEALNQSCRRHDRPEHLAFDYTRAMTAALLLWQPEPRRVLLIGVGGGSVPMALRRLRPDMRIDAVDIDPVVLKAAQRWFGLKADGLLQLHAADGVDFVARALASGQRYDAVLLDAFDAEGVPPPLFSETFLRSVRALLAPDGVFLANTFAGALSAERETAAALAAFGRVNDLRSGSGAGNRLLMAAAMPERLPAAARLWQALPSRRDALARIGIDPAWVEALRVEEGGPGQPSAR